MAFSSPSWQMPILCLIEEAMSASYHVPTNLLSFLFSDQPYVAVCNFYKYLLH
jgi:hypothetical protein